MDGLALEPWMLRADWRDDRRPALVVDLATWPADCPLDPLPPVPVIAVGPGDHPQAPRADIRIEPPVTLPALTARIAETPRAAATVVQLLRAIEGLPPERALPIESMAMAMLQAGAEHAAWRASRPIEAPSPPGMLHIARDDATIDLTIDRPWARNAIDRTMCDALHEAFALAAIDGGIERIRLRGAGRCFSMGADLAEFGTTRDPVEAHMIRARTLPAIALARGAAAFDVHVRGSCVGSELELAAFADCLTATRDAWFQLTEVAMGILPGAGGCVSIPARIGRQRAAALMLSGVRLRAGTALAWGLVDALVDDSATDPGGADATG